MACAFNQFIAAKTDYTNWYTAKQPRRVGRMASVPYFSPKTFAALKQEFTSL